MATFRELGAAPEIADALEARGIVSAFPVQELTLPLALAGRDLIGQARTGTGKTLGFGVPLLQRLEVPGPGHPQALVVVPTRELCTQVARDLAQAGEVLGARVEAIYGGRAFEPQVEALRRGVDVVVGTPGRLLDLSRQGMLDLSRVATLVLDEADEMLDLGFLPDVERILSLTSAERQTMLFSATMPGPVIALARRYLRQPTHVRAESPEENSTVPTTQQHVFRTHALDKIEVLARILQAEGRGLTMVFTRTKRTADRVAEELTTRGFAAGAVHGDLGQGARERALRAFRSGKIDVLIATDVAARGIDVPDVTHVVNYQCPEDEKTYLHRIGRTGRAGASGVAVTFVDWDEVERWKMINSILELPFPDPAETYSTSPHLYRELSIAEGVGGKLPRSARTRAGLEAEEVEDLGETGRARGGAATGGRSRGDGDGAGRRGTGGRGTGGRGTGGRGTGGRGAGDGGAGDGGAGDSGAGDSGAGDSGAGDSGRRPRTDDDADRAARARRPRRRTRSGTPVDGEAAGGDRPTSGAVAAPPDASEEAGGGEGGTRRRRRGGRGRGRSGGAQAGAGPDGAASGEPAAAPDAG